MTKLEKHQVHMGLKSNQLEIID